MAKNKDIQEINKELAKGEKGVPGWVFILALAFIVGFIFRYTIADTLRGNKKKDDGIKTIVWSEPSTIEYEEDNPGKLGDSLSDKGILLDGVYYHLPCSIYRFVENGWSVDIAGNNSKEIVYTVSSSTTKVVSLTKNNKTVKIVSVISPCEEEVSISESFVTGLSIFSWTEVDIELPEGIKIGTNRKDIERIIDSEKLKYDEERLKKDNVYEIVIPESNDKYEEYRIKLVIEEDVVSEIRVEVIYQNKD